MRTSSAETIESLVSYLDSLTGPPDLVELESHLKALQMDSHRLDRHAKFSDDHYVRNLIRSSDWYHMLVLCWHSGQRSHIHNHAGSVCGMRVLQGIATETSFEETPCGGIKATSSEDHPAGTVSAVEDRTIHQISNLQPPGQDLITLHIYSPPLLNMETYSLTDGSPPQIIPLVFEHMLGSGI